MDWNLQSHQVHSRQIDPHSIVLILFSYSSAPVHTGSERMVQLPFDTVLLCTISVPGKSQTQKLSTLTVTGPCPAVTVAYWSRGKLLQTGADCYPYEMFAYLHFKREKPFRTISRIWRKAPLESITLWNFWWKASSNLESRGCSLSLLPPPIMLPSNSLVMRQLWSHRACSPTRSLWAADNF